MCKNNRCNIEQYYYLDFLKKAFLQGFFTPCHLSQPLHIKFQLFSSDVTLHEIFELLYSFIESPISFYFISCYSSIFMKSKIEPLQSALREINNGLTCYNLLNIIRENGDLFYSVYSTPSNTFTCIHQIFQKSITPIFSDADSNKKIVEMK